MIFFNTITTWNHLHMVNKAEEIKGMGACQVHFNYGTKF